MAGAESRTGGGQGQAGRLTKADCSKKQQANAEVEDR